MANKQTNPEELDISTFELQHDYVMIVPIRVATQSGLVKSGAYEDKPEFGRVVKAGPGRTLENGTVIPLRVNQGDIVYFGKYSSVKVRTKGVDYLIIRDDDVMAIGHEESRKKV